MYLLEIFFVGNSELLFFESYFKYLAYILSAMTTIFQFVTNMTNTKGKRRGVQYIFSKPVRKHRVVPLVTYSHMYEKDDIAHTNKMGNVQKECHQKHYHIKTGGIYNVRQYADDTVVNKLRARSLPRK